MRKPCDIESGPVNGAVFETWGKIIVQLAGSGGLHWFAEVDWEVGGSKKSWVIWDFPSNECLER